MDGALPELAIKSKLSFDSGGWASLDGTLALGSPLTANVGAELHGIDPRVILDVPSAKPIDAHAHVWIVAGDVPKIDIEASTEAFDIAGNVIPAVEAKASFTGGVWRGAAVVHEDGVPAHGTFTFDAKNGLGFAVHASAVSLRKIVRVAVPVDGAASVTVKGSAPRRRARRPE